MEVKGDNVFWRILVLLVKIKKLVKVLIVFWIIFVFFFFWSSSFNIVISVIKIDGWVIILINKFKIVFMWFFFFLVVNYV